MRVFLAILLPSRQATWRDHPTLHENAVEEFAFVAASDKPEKI